MAKTATSKSTEPSSPTQSQSKGTELPLFNQSQAGAFITKLCVPRLKIYARQADNSWFRTKHGNAVNKIIDFFNLPGNQNIKAAFSTSQYGSNPALLVPYIINDI